jgi:hypothetical protein
VLIENGGPAFPTTFRNTGDLNTSAPDGEVVPPGGDHHLLGMSLRDYFAAQALPAVIDFESAAESGGGVRCIFSDAAVARGAYAIADAMLAERAK